MRITVRILFTSDCLLFFPADLHPCLLHIQRVLFHDGAFAQDASCTAEIFQRLEEQSLSFRSDLASREVILLAFRAILDPRKMDVQSLQGFLSQCLLISLQQGRPFLIGVHRPIAGTGMQVGKIDAGFHAFDGLAHFQRILE